MDSVVFTSMINQLRNERNRLLYETDKYLLPDFPISEENLEKIKEYRSALRNFFQQDEVKNFMVPHLPTKPDFLK